MAPSPAHHHHPSLFLPLLLSTVLAGVVATEPMIPSATSTTTTPAPCPPYRCGHAVDVRYPFWIDGGDGVANGTARCGYPSLRLECRRDTPVLALPSGDYNVTHIQYEDRSFTLVDPAVFSHSNTCPAVSGRNLTLPPAGALSLTARDANLNFYLNCSVGGITASHVVACLEGDGDNNSFVFRDNDDDPMRVRAWACQQVVAMPVLRTSISSSTGSGPRNAVVPALSTGFELTWSRPAVGGECGACETAGGFCGHRRGAASNAWAFTCFGTAANPDARAGPKSAASTFSAYGKNLNILAIMLLLVVLLAM